VQKILLSKIKLLCEIADRYSAPVLNVNINSARPLLKAA